MTENKTPETREEKLQAIVARIKANKEAKEQTETFAPPKDEEETPTPEELKDDPTHEHEEDDVEPPPEPHFNLSEDTFHMILARMIRDEAFFKKYGKWWPSHYFAPMTPMLPVTIMEVIYEKAVEHYEKYGLISKEALIQEIKNHLKQLKPGSEREEDWYALAEKLFAVDLESSFAKFTEDEMVRRIKHQATLEKVWVFHRDKMVGAKTTDLDRLEFSKEMVEIAKLGEDDVCLKIRTCNDVDETLSCEADDWIVTGLIANNDINIWYGPPGGNKSHLVWLLGNAVNDDKECLGIEIHQTPVTYLDLENTESIRRHFKRVLGSGNMGLITLDDEIEIPNIDSSPEKFEEFILAHVPIGVVAIDTLPMITNQTRFAESKWEADPIIKVLRRLCAKGYTFVLILHSLKADPKTIKGPQELIGRAGHLVAIYNVSDVGEERELEEIDPNKPKTLFVGTGANLKSRHKKYLYWLRADMNENSDQKGFRRMDSPSDPILEKIQAKLKEYIKTKETENPDDLFPNQGEFIELIVNLLGIQKDKERKARAWIKKGNGIYWTERELPGKGFRYNPKM